jgi:coronin-1B/1C/6
VSYDQDLKVWDVEKQKELFSYNDHPDQIHGFSWNSVGSLIATTCKDKMLRLYDPRQPAAVKVAENPAGNKVSKCCFADNHDKLLSVGFSKTAMRQYVLWDPRGGLDKPISTTDMDQAAGVLLPFYDEDTSIVYIAGKGDGVIRYFEITDEDPFVHYLSDFRSTESQKGICFVPKLACDYKHCEIAIALRLMRDHVQPISFKVPRKSDVFQKDLYPDTVGMKPGMTADEWANGTNNPAPKIGIRDIQIGQDAAQPEFKAAKSASQLQQELEEAQKLISELQARIKELEAQVQK